MFRAYRAPDVIGDFSPGQMVSNGARPVVEDGRHFIEIRQGDTAEWTRYPIDYVIGSKWQQAYATRLPDSRILVFPIQYSRNRSAWINYWGIVDAPGSERADLSRFHTIPDGAIYQTACAPCHTSQLKFTRGIEKAASGVFREAGINCEMCHGPSQAHIHRIQSGDSTPRSSHTTRRSVSAGCRRSNTWRCAASVMRNRPCTMPRRRATSTIRSRCRSIAPIPCISRRTSRERRSSAMGAIAQRRSSPRHFRGSAVLPQRRRDLRLVPRSASARCGHEPDIVEVPRRSRPDVCPVSHGARRAPRAAHPACCGERSEPMRLVSHATHHGRAAVSRAIASD